jgi:hypothetical protein
MKQISIFNNLSEIGRQIQKIYNKKVYLSELEPRLQYCLRNLRTACKAVQVAIPLGELKLKEKNGGNI